MGAHETASASFEALIAQADSRPFTGWDVGYDGRITSSRPWDYAAIVADLARASPDLLDLGTGGGEWLASLPHRPARTAATEAWPPNVPIARARLAPLGILLFAVEDGPDNVAQQGAAQVSKLPFDDGSFQLINSRHESYVPAELHRVLAPDGLFVTQQVASGAQDGFYRLFGEQPPVDPVRWTLAFAQRQLEEAGFAIEDAAEGFDDLRFADIGALAWYLKNLPFIFPDFSIPARRDWLEALQGAGPITVRQPLFRIVARRR
jgi:SAM-dependent methyltransferase